MTKSEIEIMDFNNYEEYTIYCKQHGKEMIYWDTEKITKFTNKVAELLKDPEFKKKYYDGVKKIQAANKRRVTIGGDEKDDVLSRARIILMKKQKTKNTAQPSKPNPNIQKKSRGGMYQI